MQTLRKKTSPLKFKNETTRFLSDGVSFKAKLIGILEVSEARGDRMCQEALADLKMAIRAAGEHKQRITINIAIDGLRLRDEKTGDCLYHHPVHKISFIAQDMTDSRAFGYIFGSPDTGHRFFGIKTDKAASQVVIAMRDLFQVVFALKKKEIELAKQHLEKHYVPTSPLFPRSSASKLEEVPHVSEKCRTEGKGSNAASDLNSTGTAVADLVDLELELNSLQQGLNQMERITPSDPFGSKDDPFGDSFISYPINKPILPPPPSSGRERSSRTSESSSIFSPKTPHTGGGDSESLMTTKKNSKNFSFSHELSSSKEDPSTGDWFSPNAIFEEPSLVTSESKRDEKHELAKKEIMSQFDVFTELDPLGTGRSKPYIDKKHFFQELKNPPKKAMNDLVHTIGSQQEFNINFPTVTPKTQQQTAVYTNTSTVFSADPFGEDPFVREDPFADSDFVKQDPFDSEFANYPISQLNNLDKNLKDNLQSQFQSSNLSRSPKSSTIDKQMSSVTSVSPRTVQFSKQTIYDVQFDGISDKKWHKLNELHENPSLDMSSESECAPEPPPRPVATLMQIKPPPLPPKKQNELITKPPPRPPHTDEVSHYEYLERFEAIESKILEKSPPLPVPSRKSKFDSDFTTPPERPKKSFDLQSSEEDYLTPISFPEASSSPSVLLPPPQRSAKRQQAVEESKKDNLEGLDITLSQLTLSGLNELASKLNIPPSQLSNMTLVQLTNYLSNFIKTKSQTDENSQFPTFHADFAANFSNLNSTPSESLSYDRYAVFRELQEEIKQTKIDTEPEQIQEEKEKLENNINSNINLELKPLNHETENSEDKYAALREIVDIELKQNELQSDENNQNNSGDVEDKDDISKNGALNEDQEEEVVKEINLVNQDNSNITEPEKEIMLKGCKIEYSTVDKEEEKLTTPISKSPVRSPIRQAIIKSPVPNVITDIIQNSVRLTSGSLSDVLSGSSPEIDNTGSNSDVAKKASDATGESWAIFDQASAPLETVKEQPTAQSEEGASPWSSDSKEFGNGSPSEWSRDEKERWGKGKRGRDDGWWDTSAEPEAHYYPPNRRSTDSYDEDYQNYDRPQRRRRQQPNVNWQHGQQGVSGGHSSSSRDVSPWEEEQPRRREGRREWTGRHTRGHSFERHTRERRHTDSWDDDDDYEYDEEHGTRFHWTERPERHTSRESDRQGIREKDNQRWTEDWGDDRRRRRRRDGGREVPSRDSRERWCCPDWDQNDLHGSSDKSTRYPSGRRGNVERRERPPHEEQRDHYYNRDSQDSPWEDEYSNEPQETSSPPYITTKRTTWKQRPSSASEMDRKTGEIKSRHYIAAIGGSDGERDRNRYKPGDRRSRSRDSQYSEPSTYRHKMEQIRNTHRNKAHLHTKTPDTEFGDAMPLKLSQDPETGKKSSACRKKQLKESPKSEDNVCSTFPRKSSNRSKNLFENDFVAETSSGGKAKFNFADFGKDVESSSLNRSIKGLRQQSLFEKGRSPIERDVKEKLRGKELKLSPRYQTKSKSLFEDDFSPSERSEHGPEDSSISSIKEEEDSFGTREEEDTFGAENFENATNGRRKILAKNRLSSAKGDHLKKSGSVNIFGRENDPFDDDFFCGNLEEEKISPKSTELRWTDDFEDYKVSKKN